MNLNPFRTNMSSSNVPDSTESRESKSILAPAQFRPFDTGNSSISSTSKFVLRPSLLSAHTSHLSDKDSSNESTNEALPQSNNEATDEKPENCVLGSSNEEVSDTVENLTSNNRDPASGCSTSPDKTESTNEALPESNSEATVIKPKNDDSGSSNEEVSDTVDNPTSSRRDPESGCSTDPGKAELSVSSSTDKCSFSAINSKYNSTCSSSSNDTQNNGRDGGGFVFGQNIHERVINVDDEASSSVPSNGTAELSFAQTALVVKSDPEKVESDSASEALSKSLSESAKEYESRQVKRTYDRVDYTTGEESEVNILQVFCILYLFDEGNWVEKGRGMLRLNVRESDPVRMKDVPLICRLIMRAQGNLRVVLNCRLWHTMIIKMPSKKTITINVMDSGVMKLYLIKTSAKEAEQLYNELNERLQELKVIEEEINFQSQPKDVDSTTENSDVTPVKKAKVEDSFEADTSSAGNC